MRRTSQLGIVFGLIFCALFVSPAARGQLHNTNTVILEPVAQWRYNQLGTDLGTAWRAFSYPQETSWPMDFSAMGWPLNEELPFDYDPPYTVYTQLNISNGPPPHVFTRTFYFRTTFVFTNTPFTNVILVASNLIDDGAVFYLNGVEVGRVGMATGTVAYATQATRQDDIYDRDTGSGRSWDVLTFSPQNLRNGTNVLAVEVHQGGATSSDIIFTTSLSYFRGVRPAITRQISPTNLVVACAGKRINFSVQATGTDLVYLWYTNGVYVTNQSGPLMTLTPPVMTGTVHCIVSNALGTVQSSNATLIVFPDQCGPRALLAESRDAAGASNQIDLTFDEPVLSVATDTNNYRIFATNQPGLNVRVTGVSGPGTTIRMTLSTNLYRTNGYVLRINNIRDGRNNTIAPNTDIPIGFKSTTNLFESGDVFWKYVTVFDCNYNLGLNWTNLLYNDDETNGWGFNIAPFARDFDQEPRCSTDPPTSLSVANAHYFRKRFTVDTNLNLGSRVELNLRYAVDDGAVFYLNGTEIYRIRMPAGPVSCFTRPNANGEYPCITVPIDIDSDVLNVGRLATNLIAVELHEAAQPPDPFTDFDAVFDLDLTLSTFNGPILRAAPRPRLTMLRQAANVILSWPTNGVGTNNGYILEATDIANTNAWREVQPMSNPVTNTVSGARRFYRLRWEAP